ncbi:MAG: DUF1588 domain-containing protein [Akkermansiaceae bacterium]|nr:DUF1588 domain-containing protein [Akkermansiaceae bacterium]
MLHAHWLAGKAERRYRRQPPRGKQASSYIDTQQIKPTGNHRPYAMAFVAESPLSGGRLVAIVGIVLLHIGVYWALENGLAQAAMSIITGPLETKIIDEPIDEVEEPPPPPPNIPQLTGVSGHGDQISLRAQMEKHRDDPACSSCHALMDPIGFGLENYDATGAWRDQEHGKPIATDGKLATGESLPTPRTWSKLLPMIIAQNFIVHSPVNYLRIL